MPSRVFLRAMERTVTHDHCDAQALLFKRGTVSRELLQALPCRMVSRGCPSNRWLLWSAITVSGNWRRQASVPRMDGWSAEDVFIPSADNFEDERGLGGGAVDHARQTCHQPGQLPIVCHTVPDRHVPVAHPILSTASVHRSTEGRTAIH